MNVQVYCFYLLTGINRKLILIRVAIVKRNGHGQSAIISDIDYGRIRKALKAKKSKLLLDIARYTGERWGALIQLQVEDVFDLDGKPRDYITFRASIRKAAPDGKRQTRQVPTHPHLKELLEGYPSPASGYLFESPIIAGKPISLRAADFMFRAAVYQAGLDHRGYSTHSTRRTFISSLYERGIDIHTIQKITGHSDLKSLVRYIDIHPDRIIAAVSVL